jgi:hypothetical protein
MVFLALSRQPPVMRYVLFPAGNLTNFVTGVDAPRETSARGCLR